MQGTTITYRYANGHSYNLTFTEAEVSYRDLSGSDPEQWLGPFRYHSTEIENNVHLLAWHEPERGDYVTLLVNFNSGTIYSSAIVNNTETYFTEATLTGTESIG